MGSIKTHRLAALTDTQREFLNHMYRDFPAMRQKLAIQRQACFHGLDNDHAHTLSDIAQLISADARRITERLLEGEPGDIASQSQQYVQKMMAAGLFNEPKQAANFYLITAQLAAGDAIIRAERNS